METKRILSTLLGLVMVLALLPTAVFADTAEIKDVAEAIGATSTMIVKSK